MRHQNLNWQKLQVAAFDWDNTLALTRPALECSINEVLQQNGLPTWNEIKNKRDANLSFRDNFPVLFGDKAAALYAAGGTTTSEGNGIKVLSMNIKNITVR